MMGYVPVPLQKVSDDARFSGFFEVNGEPLRFLIDSGANSTDLESDIATRVGIRRNPAIKVVTRGALGREIRSGHGRGTLRVGPMQAEDFPFTIAPNATRETSTSRYAGQVGLMPWTRRVLSSIFPVVGCGFLDLNPIGQHLV